MIDVIIEVIHDFANSHGAYKKDRGTLKVCGAAAQALLIREALTTAGLAVVPIEPT